MWKMMLNIDGEYEALWNQGWLKEYHSIISTVQQLLSLAERLETRTATYGKTCVKHSFNYQMRCNVLILSLFSVENIFVLSIWSNV